MSTTVSSAATAFAEDDELFAKTHKHSNADLLVAAAKMSGRSSVELGRDFLRHRRSGRGIELADYVRHQLWNSDAHGADGAARFIGAKTHWPVVNRVNSVQWNRVAEDKHVMHSLVAAAGLRQPETVAFLDASSRIVPGLPKISSTDDLRTLFTAHPAGSLFLKTAGGMIGQGAFVIEAADATSVTCGDREPMSYEGFLGQVIGPHPYLVQKRIENHPAIAPYLTGLATIRFPNFMRAEGPFIPCVAMKLPANGNVTCAYWRPGNLAAEIDIATGRIVRLAHRKGPVSESIADHPGRSGLMGLELPYWSEVLDLNRTAANVFSPIAYNSTDIALTPDGPVLVEINYGGSFDILQNATGRGVLTDEIATWFAKRGVDFARKPRKLRLIRS